MPGFFSTEQPSRFLQGGIAGKTFGFVEEKNAVDRAFGGFGCILRGGCLLFGRSKSFRRACVF